MGVSFSGIPVQGIKDNSSTTIELSDTTQNGKLESCGAVVLSHLLASNTSVTSVGVSGNQLGPEGGKAIADALQTNVVLQSIEIGCKYNPAIIPIKQLRDNSVDVLDYSGKELLSEGGIVLAAALTVAQNTSVTTVEVKSNCLRAKGMMAIAEALKVNSTVTNMDVSDNEIGGWYEYGTFGDFTATPEGPAALAEALEVNTTVQWVDVSQNSLGPEGGKALASAL